MPARMPLLVAAFAVAAGTAAGKPPGLPTDPHPEGRERCPVERAFDAPLRPAGPLGFAAPWPRAEAAGMNPAHLETWRALNRLPADLLGLALPRLGWY